MHAAFCLGTSMSTPKVQGLEGGSKVGRKRSKAYYGTRQSKRKKHGLEELSPGMCGVLITTNDQEKICVSEAYNLLNEYADALCGPETTTGESSGSDASDQECGDIETAVAKEIQTLKGMGVKERRFQAVNSGAKHVVFIKCREPVEPCQLVHYMLSEMLSTKVHKSRFCQRVIPVARVCRATLGEIEKDAVVVLEPHFHIDDLRPLRFAVSYKARNNNVIKRDDVIQLLASMVTRNGDFPHTVDLNNPERTVLVEIVKNLCCLSVVKDFHKLKKYNIQSIMEAALQDSDSKPTEEGVGSTMPGEVLPAVGATKDKDTSPRVDSREGHHRPEDKDEVTDIVETGDPSCEGESEPERAAEGHHRPEDKDEVADIVETGDPSCEGESEPERAAVAESPGVQL